MSSKKENESECKMCKVIPGLKPLTPANVAFHYLPLFGAANYATLSINVMNPSLISSMIPSRDVTNILLINSVVGSGLYIYSRRHLQPAPQQIRLMYSGFEAVMFNFGSVLLWAVLRTVSPRSNCISTILGLVTGGGLIYAGHSILKYIDHTISSSSSISSK
uniref:Uncharacterized protein n=1 Tax=Riptortus pedestris TaxID=329032 RepID=R4WDB8_RIPPE|nr:conserved hypothetical protein [Riptortus pedestris]